MKLKTLTLILTFCLLTFPSCESKAFPFIGKHKAVQALPEPVYIYSFKNYNDYPGKIETDISKYTEIRQVESKGVISPDKERIAYSTVYFYPNAHHTASRLFFNQLLEKDPSYYSNQEIGKIIDSGSFKRNSVKLAETGFDGQKKEYFKSFSIIDWSIASDKILFKETQGEYLRGIWSTSLWVYDFKSDKVIKLEEARKAVLYFWKTYKKFDLSEWRWDILPLGWDKKNHNQIIFKAYGYNNDGKVFMGIWTINADGERTKLISLDETEIDIGQYGLDLVKVEQPYQKKKKKKKHLLPFG